MCVCVREMFSGMPFDTERVLEMQFPPFLYMGVFMLGLLEYESVAPRVSLSLCPLPLPRSPFRSFFGLRGLSGWLMH